MKEKLLKSILPVIALVLLMKATSCKKSSDPVSYSGSTMLSESRASLAAAGAGNKVFFAGGLGNNGASKTVDIYDIPSNTWTTALLSEARGSLAGAAAGNKILFAGGFSDINGVSKTVDIYDVPSNTWSTAHLSEARQYLAAATAGNKIFFAGGDSDLNSVYNNVYLGVFKTPCCVGYGICLYSVVILPQVRQKNRKKASNCLIISPLPVRTRTL
jgi:hypothetical protein